MDLDETMRLKHAYTEILRRNEGLVTCSVAAFAHERMFELLRSRHTVCPARVALFSSVDQYIGALFVQPMTVFVHAKKIWEVVDEDLSMCSVDVADGFCLELNYYDEGNRYVADGVYQMTGWGAFSDVPEMMRRAP